MMDSNPSVEIAEPSERSNCREYRTPCYNLGETARRLRISPDHVADLIRIGELVGHHNVSGELRVAQGAIDVYLERREVQR